ncbi:hypothetical protein OKN36_15160 [Furfurilactobacillus sp. OKN36]
MKEGRMTIRINVKDRDKYLAVKELLGANSDSETVSKMARLCWQLFVASSSLSVHDRLKELLRVRDNDLTKINRRLTAQGDLLSETLYGLLVMYKALHLDNDQQLQQLTSMYTDGTPENGIVKQLRAQVMRDKDRNQTIKREGRTDE